MMWLIVLIPPLLVLPLILAAARVAGPTQWYRRLRYGSIRPVIVVNFSDSTTTLRGFHPRGERRAAKTIWIVDSAGLPLLHCPRDLMRFVVTDAEEAGVLFEHRRPS